MEADEIRVVLERASELHGKFNEAIERALKSDFLQSSSGGILDSDFASALDGDEINGMESFNREFIKAAGKDGISNAEARTLGLIRDALEALEEQLQALQSMQNHQRAEKDAVLAELEESRHLLLIKLKNHRGREWEVVREALAFAGEPVEERDDLLLPPYPRPVVDDSLAVNTQPSKQLSRTISLPKGRAVKKLILSERDQEVDKDVHRNKDISEAVKGKQDSQEQVIPEHQVHGEGVVTSAGGFMRGLVGRVGHALVHVAKAVFVVASVVAFLAFTEHNHRQVEQMPRPAPSATKPIFELESRVRAPSPLKCSPGKKRIVLEDGSEKCVVKERFELPFPREVESPDVLHGRG